MIADLRILFVYANSMMENLIPVGASAVLGVLRELRTEVRLFDTTFYCTEEQSTDIGRAANLQVLPVDMTRYGVKLKDADYVADFAATVTAFDPDIVMFSAIESSWFQVEAMLAELEGRDNFVLCGGILGILDPEFVISDPRIDAVCIGEGEDTVRIFCERYATGDNIAEIPGLWVRDGARIRRNPIAALVDLERTPLPDYSLYEPARFYKPMEGRAWRMLPVEFSRGCPYRCAYCANHAIARCFAAAGQWYRRKSMDRVFAEIEHAATNHNVEFLYFVSETFLTMPEALFKEFCERYARYRIPFWFNTRPESITAERLARVEEVGCFRIGVGLEHGNADFRRQMLNRKCTNEQIVEACHLIEASKISYSINNIIGFPGETRELVMDTIMLNRQITPDTTGVFVFTPFRGTDLYRYCVDNGYLDPDTPVGDLNRMSVLKNTPLSDGEVRGLLRTFPLYTHFPEDMFDEIRIAEGFDDEGNRAYEALAGRYRREHFA